MKLSTCAIVLGPIALVFAVLTVINPTWIKEFSLLQCLVIGAVVGSFGAAVAMIFEPKKD